MYQKISKHPSVLAQYESYLKDEEIISDEEAKKIRKDYRNFIHPNEPSKELMITIFGESDNYKQVELHLSLKNEDREKEPGKVYEDEDMKMFDTGKGYEIYVTGL